MRKLFTLITLLIAAIGINSLKAQIAWPQNGSNIYYNVGNVGIGTMNPTARLQVYQIDVSSGEHQISNFGETNAVKGVLISYDGDGSTVTAGRLRTFGTVPLRLGTSGSIDAVTILPTTGNVGIGTTTPTEKLSVNGNLNISTGTKIGWNVADAWTNYGYSTAHYGVSYGCTANPLTLSGYFGLSLATWGIERVKISANGNVGIGTTNPQYKLTVEGTIATREVKVTAETWSDFVFHPSYKLRTLGEVEQFIKTNSHLPEIPTTAEVKENGVSLGEMNTKLLQKVEELTLYLIEQNKKMDQQQVINEKQNQLIKMLEQKIEKIITKK